MDVQPTPKVFYGGGGKGQGFPTLCMHIKGCDPEVDRNRITSRGTLL